MVVGVVRAVETRREPCRLSVRHARDLSRGKGLHELLLPGDGADLQARVLWAEEDFVTMETEEGLRCVLASCVNGELSAWMC